MSAMELQKAYFDWIDTQFVGVDSIALTLTFKRRVGTVWLSEDIAQGSVHQFLRRINRVGRGQRLLENPRLLRSLAVREGGVRRNEKRLHYHLQLEVPCTTPASVFAATCCATWRKLDWAGLECRTKVGANSGWTSYILKTRTKADYSYAIDLSNCVFGATTHFTPLGGGGSIADGSI